jgi:hypothetical protein
MLPKAKIYAGGGMWHFMIPQPFFVAVVSSFEEAIKVKDCYRTSFLNALASPIPTQSVTVH